MQAAHCSTNAKSKETTLVAPDRQLNFAGVFFTPGALLFAPAVHTCRLMEFVFNTQRVRGLLCEKAWCLILCTVKFLFVSEMLFTPGALQCGRSVHTCRLMSRSFSTAMSLSSSATCTRCFSFANSLCKSASVNKNACSIRTTHALPCCTG